jgi:hypothetical protein
MRTLIIPDIHHHIENADYWLETQQFDHAVFLGDYFDDFEDHIDEAREAAFWLRRRMKQGRDVFLIGNHDLPYMFPGEPFFQCSGFSKKKSAAIRQILKPEHWRRFKIAHAEQGWLMSHAGFHPFWVEEPTPAKILRRSEQALGLARNGKYDPLLGAGRERGGPHYLGGPLWLDWQSFIPVPHVNQIVGHTPGSEVRVKFSSDSKNICLDVHQGSVAAMIVDGALDILKRESP